MSDVVNGYRIIVNDDTIEMFLGAYGETSRYFGDTPAARRRDARLAAERLRLLTDDGDTGVRVTAIRTDIDEEMTLGGFLEIYEPVAIFPTERDLNLAMLRLAHALESFIASPSSSRSDSQQKTRK